MELRRTQYSQEFREQYRKLEACRRTKPELAETFTTFAASITQAETLESSRLFEARAAIIYWSTWNSPLKWKEKDVPVE